LKKKDEAPLLGGKTVTKDEEIEKIGEKRRNDQKGKTEKTLGKRGRGDPKREGEKKKFEAR